MLDLGWNEDWDPEDATYGSHVDCPYCEKRAEFVDSAEVYNGKSYGMIYLCRPCQAWVGCHRRTGKPLGTIANASLRRARMQAHREFDELWKEDRGKRQRKGRRRTGWYEWLAWKMDMPVSECHIGSMNEKQCARVVELSVEKGWELVSENK